MTIVFIAADPQNVGTASVAIRYAYAITGKADHYFVYGTVVEDSRTGDKFSEEQYQDYLFGGIVRTLTDYYRKYSKLPIDLSVMVHTTDFDSSLITPLDWQGYKIELPD